MVGFKEEFTDRIIGVNPHIVIKEINSSDKFEKMKQKKRNLLMKSKNWKIYYMCIQLSWVKLWEYDGKYSGLQVIGIDENDLKNKINRKPEKIGNLDDFDRGISIGYGISNSLRININQKIRLISPDGLRTLFGTTPRIGDFEVKYIFKVGRYDIDRYRLYMPILDAQQFFNKKNQIDQINIILSDVNNTNKTKIILQNILGNNYEIWT